MITAMKTFPISQTSVLFFLSLENRIFLHGSSLLNEICFCSRPSVCNRLLQIFCAALSKEIRKHKFSSLKYCNYIVMRVGQETLDTRYEDEAMLKRVKRSDSHDGAHTDCQTRFHKMSPLTDQAYIKVKPY